jgi:uncharacterized protein
MFDFGCPHAPPCGKTGGRFAAKEIFMRKHSWTLCLAVLLLAASPAPAQSPPPDALAAARELLVTMRMADQFKAILPTIMQSMKPVIVQGRPEIERDFDAIVPTLLEGMNARLNELSDLTAAVYASNFSADELRDITAFYRTPTGEKFLQKLPVVTQQSIALGQRFGQAVAGDLQGRIVDELRKRGHKI